MSRKLFYMIRHGESVLNAEHIRQGREGALSDRGQEQARETGEHLKHIEFDAVLVSPYQRTMETAELILQKVKSKKPPEYIDLLTERKNPSEIVGKSADDPEVRNIVDLIDKSFHRDDFRYSDEENFNDLKDRARRLLVYLATRKEKKILVVTHSIFLKMVAAYIALGPALNAEKYNLLSFLNTSTNASVTVVEYNAGLFPGTFIGKMFFEPVQKWKILVWDEYIVKPKNRQW